MNTLPPIEEQMKMGSLRRGDAVYDYKTWQVVPEYIPHHLVTKFSEHFQLYDPKDTGVITIEDVSSILRKMERQVSSEQIKEILKDLIGEEAMPYSSADYVDFKEYLSVISVLTTECISEDEMYKVFSRIDLDGDGYITSEELGRLLSQIGNSHTEDNITEMIMEADRDGDGKVSYDEFVCLLTNSEGKKVDKEAPPLREIATKTEAVFDKQDDLRKNEEVNSNPAIKITVSCEISRAPVQRMRSFSLGSPVQLELPQIQNPNGRRKKSISELLHLPTLRKGKSDQNLESRRSSVTVCSTAESLGPPPDKSKRRFSASGLHFKNFFK